MYVLCSSLFTWTFSLHCHNLCDSFTETGISLYEVNSTCFHLSHLLQRLQCPKYDTNKVIIFHSTARLHVLCFLWLFFYSSTSVSTFSLDSALMKWPHSNFRRSNTTSCTVCAAENNFQWVLVYDPRVNTQPPVSFVPVKFPHYCRCYNYSQRFLGR